MARDQGHSPRRSRHRWPVRFAVELLVLALLWSRPDIGPLIERARPYIGDFWQSGARVVPGAAPA